METEKYLEHHGVIGMKWGVRRSDSQLGHKTSSSSKLKKGLEKNISQEGLVAGVLDTKLTGKNKGKSKIDIKYDQAKKISELNEKKKEIEFVKKGGDLETAKNNNDKLARAIADRISGNSNSRYSEKRMTTEDLKGSVARLELEKKYRDLKSNEAQAHMSAGDKFVNGAKDVMATSLKNAASTWMTKKMTDALMGQSSNNNGTSTQKNNVTSSGEEYVNDTKKNYGKELVSILKTGADNYKKYTNSVGDHLDAYNNMTDEQVKNTASYKAGKAINSGSKAIQKYVSGSTDIVKYNK